MPRRSESRSKPQKTEPDDLYGLFIQNLPRGVGWQDLKDQIRQICPTAKVKHADVREHSDGINDGISHIIINGKETAMTAYQHLAANGYEARSVTVALAKADHMYETNSYKFTPIAPSRTSPPARAKNLFNPHGPSVARQPTIPIPSSMPMDVQRDSAVAWSAVNPTLLHNGYATIPYSQAGPALEAATPYPVSYSAQYHNMTRVPTGSTLSMVNANTASPYPGPTASKSANTKASDSKSVREPPSCPSVNRGIYIQNLDHKVTWRLLKDKLSKFGEVTRCDVTPEKLVSSSSSHGGGLFGGRKHPPRQVAMVTFTSREAAVKAVNQFDGYDLLGRKMRVKLNDDKSRSGGSSKGAAGATISRKTVSTSSAAQRRTTARQGKSSGGGGLAKLRAEEIKGLKRSDSPLVIDGSAASKKFAGRQSGSDDTSDSDEDDDEDEDDSDDDSHAEESITGGSSQTEDDTDDATASTRRRLHNVRI